MKKLLTCVLVILLLISANVCMAKEVSVENVDLTTIRRFIIETFPEYTDCWLISQKPQYLEFTTSLESWSDYKFVDVGKTVVRVDRTAYYESRYSFYLTPDGSNIKVSTIGSSYFMHGDRDVSLPSTPSPTGFLRVIKATFNGWISTGINLEKRKKDDCFVIKSVDEYSSAHKAGLKSGDLISHINGTPVNSMKKKAVEQILDNSPEGTPVNLTLKLADSQPKTLTITSAHIPGSRQVPRLSQPTTPPDNSPPPKKAE